MIEIVNLDDLERSYADIKVALYEVERMREELSKLSSGFNEALATLEKLRSKMTAEWSECRELVAEAVVQ